MQLTPKMRETLLQIGFGVIGDGAGYSTVDTDEHVDMRSAHALGARGLVNYHVERTSPTLRGALGLTIEGERLFEELRHAVHRGAR